jgi:hypothetical protein
MFQDFHGDSAPAQLAGIVVSGFAKAVFAMTPGSWQGPVESGYGWHRVVVDTNTSAQVPSCEEAEPDIRTEWMAEQRARSKQSGLEATRARYTLALPDDVARAVEEPVKPWVAGLHSGGWLDC